LCGQQITPMTDMQRHLREMFEDVRRFLVREGLGRLDVVQMNAKGDVTKEFDFLAEARIIEWCRQAIAEPVRILTEERGEVRTRPGRAAWTLIVDPVDGSENFARGNECSSVSLAALPGDKIPHPDAVSHAVVGRIFGGTVLEAVKGFGAWRNGVPVRPSTVQRIEDAIVGVDFFFPDHRNVARLDGLLRAARDVRRFGTAAGELAMVACGGLDAYVDVRDALTPENYMASVRIIVEAGGVVSDRAGRPLAPITSMTQGQSVVAAANPTLHTHILGVLDRRCP
jgi:myo-inositol-1(or 4)-monophosphatase